MRLGAFDFLKLGSTFPACPLRHLAQVKQTKAADTRKHQTVMAPPDLQCIWTRCGNLRNSQFVARMSRQRVLHQLLRYLPRPGRVDTSLNVDLGKFVELEPRVFVQLLALPSEIGLLGT